MSNIDRIEIRPKVQEFFSQARDWMPKVKSRVAAARTLLTVLTTPVAVTGALTAYDMLVPSSDIVTTASAAPNLETCRDIVVKETVRYYKEKNGKDGYQEGEDELGGPVKNARIIWVVNNNFNEAESKTDDNGYAEKRFGQTTCDDETGKKLEVLKWIVTDDDSLLQAATFLNGVVQTDGSYLQERSFWDRKRGLFFGSLAAALMGIGVCLGQEQKKANKVASKTTDKEDSSPQVEELKSQLSTLTQENAGLRDSKILLDAQNIGFKAQIDELGRVTTYLNQENSRLRATITGLEGNTQNLTTQVSGLMTTNIGLEGTVKSLSEELEKMKAEKVKDNQQSNADNPKSADWIRGWQDFEKRWQSAKSKIVIRPGDTGNEPQYVFERFIAAMDIIHQVSAVSAINAILMAVRVRAGIEYLIPEVWPDQTKIKKFFDPNFNAGFTNGADIARAIYIPAGFRTASNFTDSQKEEILKIRRTFRSALHQDTARNDSDNNLYESIQELHRVANTSWIYMQDLGIS